jgi:hypothetical protein
MLQSEQTRHGWLKDRLWALTMAPESALEASRWRKLLSGEIRGLLAMLSERFAAEEAGGYLAQVVRVRPDLQAQVALLQEQHVTILADLDAVDAGLRGGRDVLVSQMRLRAVLALLRAHEHGEHDLLQESLSHDPDALELFDAQSGGQR